jgi:precorrin-2 dehydrogenase / sirohydrochlorin ferrochelatase
MTLNEKPMYPVFLRLEGRRCLVVGGGEVAERKIEKLLESGARVMVVAPRVTEAIKEMDSRNDIVLDEREYIDGEAAAYYLVIAATNIPAVNKRVSEDADMAGRPVNVVDVPPLCSFYVPSIVRRGDLQIAVSTAGAAPSLAKKIRHDLECAFPESYSKLLELLRVFRDSLMEREPDESKRKEMLGDVARSPLIEKFLEGDESPLEDHLKRCV